MALSMPTNAITQELEAALTQFAQWLRTDGPEGIVRHDLREPFAIFDAGRGVMLTDSEQVQAVLRVLQEHELTIEHVDSADPDEGPKLRFEHTTAAADGTIVQTVLRFRVAGTLGKELPLGEHGTIPGQTELDEAVVLYLSLIKGENQYQVVFAVVSYDLPSLVAKATKAGTPEAPEQA